MAIDPMREPAGITITGSQINSAAFTKWTMAMFGAWNKDGDGARTNGGGIVGDIALTLGIPPFTTVFDYAGGATPAFEDIGGSSALPGWSNDWQLTADAANEEGGTPGAGNDDGDAVYFGHTVPFAEIALHIDINGVIGTKAFEWEYFNGTSWASLSLVLDNTDTANQDGDESFQQPGAISFIPPLAWASTSVNGQPGFWIRARCVVEQITTTPILTTDFEHELVSPSDGFTCPHDGTVTGIRLIDRAATLHTTSDVKFIVMNFTTGAHTGELTFAQDQRQDSWASPGTMTALAVSRDDELGVLNTAEDTNNDDPEDVVLELQVTRT